MMARSTLSKGCLRLLKCALRHATSTLLDVVLTQTARRGACMPMGDMMKSCEEAAEVGVAGREEEPPLGWRC